MGTGDGDRNERLRDAIDGQDPAAARSARTEVDRLVSETVTAWRKDDTRALRRAMEGVCVASVVREPAGEPDGVDVAFLADVDAEPDVERVIAGMAREWDGRVDVRLFGAMAAYDFAGTAQPQT